MATKVVFLSSSFPLVIPSASSGTQYTVTLTDSISSTDSLSRLAKPTKTDSVSSSDSASKTISKFATDAQSSSDTISASVSHGAQYVTLTDSISTSDTLAKSVARTLTDPQGSSDSIARTFSKTLTDSESVSDSAITVNVTHGVHVVTLTDSISSTDSMTRTTNRHPSDSVTSSDSVSRAFWKAPLADGISVSDSSIQEVVAHFYRVSLTDLVSSTDSLPSKSFGKSANDSITSPDSITIVAHTSAQPINAPISLLGSIVNTASLSGSIVNTAQLQGGVEVAVTNQNFSMYVGQEFTFEVTVSNLPPDSGLTGCTVNWVMQPSVNSQTATVAKSTTNGGITITDAPNGKFQVTLQPSDTAGKAPYNYYHEAQVTDVSGNPYPVTVGTLTLLPSASTL